ncbi:uncharacterized protein Z518_11275 [Rhinocladiella mackenziei CBS 650.93]|uniref:Carnosine N-methyltransferase n=1 Tax=Rhinocladiella mackenziei CBS 650.93 TaxID=1442369 RepID=A0A0D2FBS7_9EURO|nr:uncharacterized protein Z518_11275 [Rhinocladiella mackenziei CBS 650.93]KIW99536.1 hypothetical protein Z518_11275 [Rhinocladiella mackenziei CBS 650.93]
MKWSFLWFSLSLVAFHWATFGACAQHPPDEAQICDSALHLPLTVYETHINFLTISHRVSNPSSHLERHEKERSALLSRLRSGKNDVRSKKRPRYFMLKALYGLQRYEETNQGELKRLQSLYESISKVQRKFIESKLNYTTKFDKCKSLFSSNNQLVRSIVENAFRYYEISNDELDSFASSVEKTEKPDRISISQALKHVVRDWSQDGYHEWIESYRCIIETLKIFFPDHAPTGTARLAKSPLKILLPGSGLNRLAHEISKIGRNSFEVTANEFSPYMNIVYRYLTTITTPSSLYLYPYLDNWSHQPSLSEQQRGVHFPDTLPSMSDVLLVEGDFTHVFSGSEWAASQDVLITHFFLDTARNVLSYVNTIRRVLKPGGVWINFGPLLWSYNTQLKLSLEEIVTISEAVGFDFLETNDSFGPKTLGHLPVRSIHAPYGFNQRALTENAYKAQFWVAQKKTWS